MGGVRRRWAWGPLVALVAVVGVCSAAVPDKVPFPLRRPAAEAVPAGAADPVAADRLTQVRALLDRRSTALVRHDRAGWLAGVDPAATALRARQAAFLANIRAVPLSTWRYTVEPGDATGTPDRAGTWTVRATLRYGLRGVDPVPTERPAVLTFADRGGRWLLTADDRVGPSGERTWRGPWEHGPLVVRSGTASLVLAHPANAGRLASIAAGVDAVVPEVRRVVGRTTPARVAVIVPDDQAEMAALVGDKLVLSAIAAVAVADAVDIARTRAVGQRVVVNPANIDRLGSLGRRVVLEHEVTHLATRAITGPDTPIWLVEGLADWVGYGDSGLTARQVGDQLHAALRTGRWPGVLPGPADFRGDSPHLARAYEEGWSACRLIALYRAVGTAADPDTALDTQLRRRLGVGTAQFQLRWRAEVRADFG
jgi:hypothetical protein